MESQLYMYLFGVSIALLIVGLGVLYWKDSGVNYTIIKTGGPYKGILNDQQLDKIIQQKIQHKNIAFGARLMALAIAFAVGIWTLVDFMHRGKVDWTLFGKLIELAGGVGATVGFTRLHSQCSDDVDKLMKQK